jgi:predicted secreted Zn-dependent protease
MWMLLTGLFLGAATPGLTIVESTEYYEVTGASAQELLAAIARGAPRDEKGRRGVGMTYWEARWQYQLKQTPSGCVRTSFDMNVKLVIMLPRWKNRYDATALADRWNIYVAALEGHERGHLEIALRGAQEMHERLSQIDSAKTCDQLEQLIDTTGESLLDDLDRVQSDYDRRTRHGATQGVNFQ